MDSHSRVARRPAQAAATAGASPMWTFRDHEALKQTIVDFTRRRSRSRCTAAASRRWWRLSDGSYLVKGKTVTGFSNAEEDYSDAFVGQKMMPWRIEDALRERGATYVQGGLLKAFAVRDGRLITGQQQYSSRKVADTLIGMLGV
jgi:putative intracellular protease/amidase